MWREMPIYILYWLSPSSIIISMRRRRKNERKQRVLFQRSSPFCFDNVLGNSFRWNIKFQQKFQISNFKFFSTIFEFYIESIEDTDAIHNIYVCLRIGYTICCIFIACNKYDSTLGLPNAYCIDGQIGQKECFVIGVWELNRSKQISSQKKANTK